MKEEIKKREYWLTGGIIGGIFFFIYFFVINYLPSLNRFICIEGNESFFNCFGIKYLQIMGFPASIIKKIDFLNNLSVSAKGLLAVFILLIFYFLIGAIIGHFYGKFKTRKEIINEELDGKIK